MDQNQNKGNQGRSPFHLNQNLVILILAVLFSFFLMNMGKSMLRDKSQEEVSYTEFYQMLKSGEVESVLVGDTKISIQMKADAKSYSPLKSYYTYRMDDIMLPQVLIQNGVDSSEKAPDSTGFIWDILIGLVLPFAGVFLIMSLMMRRMGGGGGIMGVGKSTAKMYMEKQTGVTFADVAGEDEAKESLVEIVDFLHNPEKYRSIGAKLPKGALLVGPPGTGKTLLAKAVAGEAEVPFFSLSGSDFVEMFVGVGASRVRDLFKQANNVAPCIIFIDEIDAIGKSRDSRLGGNDEREQTLNQLLSEMDGFDAGKGIMVLGATNRPEILDPALLRPGRFDRRVIVEKPDLKGRVSILKVHSKHVKLDKTVDFEEIGLATSGAVGADLANMMNEAAITAVKNGRKAVSQKDLFEAVEVVLVGKEKKDRILSQEERRIVSYHEVGHALIAAVQKHAEPVQKITIVPRTMGALGYVMQMPEEEKYLNTKKELEAMLVTTLGGRAAEELKFDTVTTGAANDIERATAVARAMVTQYGMSERFGLMGLAKTQDMYLSGRTVMECGDDTATEVDEEVMHMLKAAYAEAKEILSAHSKALDEIAAYLIQKETITGKEFMRIFREVEGLPEPPETAGSSDRLSEETQNGGPGQTAGVSNADTKATGSAEAAFAEENAAGETKQPEPAADPAQAAAGEASQETSAEKAVMAEAPAQRPAAPETPGKPVGTQTEESAEEKYRKAMEAAGLKLPELTRPQAKNTGIHDAAHKDTASGSRIDDNREETQDKQQGV